jgi:hypothetical protein
MRRSCGCTKPGHWQGAGSDRSRYGINSNNATTQHSIKDKSMATPIDLDQKLAEQLLLNRPREGDRLLLADAVLLAALDGSRPLTGIERRALQQSPLTLRRFRHLALQAQQRNARAGARGPGQAAANDALWRGSSGLLRAADSGAALDLLQTDDRYWTLHFVPEGGGWQVILALDPEAPFAAGLLPTAMQAVPRLRVIDGAGVVILQGQLDSDGECEVRWPFTADPAAHFQQCGASFRVQPIDANLSQ